MLGYELGGEMNVKATAYDACMHCCGKTDGITRSGTKAKVNHTIAVDPSVIPIGTKIYIPELGRIFTAEDTGGAIKGNRIDIYMENHSQAKDFGVQNLQAYILKGSQQK